MHVQSKLVSRDSSTFTSICLASASVIANLVTVFDSEQRLGKTLLQIARKLGKKDPRAFASRSRFLMKN